MAYGAGDRTELLAVPPFARGLECSSSDFQCTVLLRAEVFDHDHGAHCTVASDVFKAGRFCRGLGNY